MCKQASFNIYYFETTANAILLQTSQNQCVFKILHRVNANTRQSVGKKLNEKHLKFSEVHFTGYCVSVPYLIFLCSCWIIIVLMLLFRQQQQQQQIKMKNGKMENNEILIEMINTDA